MKEQSEQLEGFKLEKNIATAESPINKEIEIEDEEEYEIGKVNIIGAKTSIAYGRSGEELTNNYVIRDSVIKYTITLTNTGNEKGNIVITDDLNKEVLEYITSNSSKGTVSYDYETGILTWEVEIEPEESVTIEIETKVRLLKEEIKIDKNIAYIEVDEEEKDPIEDEEEYILRQPDIEIVKSSEAYDYQGQEIIKTGTTTVIHEGDTIKYTITVKNNGEETEWVEIIDRLDLNKLDYISGSSSKGAIDFNSETGVFEWEGNVNKDETITIEIVVKAKSIPSGDTEYTIGKNVIEIRINDQDEGEEEDPDDYIVTEQKVVKAKTSMAYDDSGNPITDRLTLYEGETIVYTLVITNDGEALEKDIIVTDYIDVNKVKYITSNSEGKGKLDFVYAYPNGQMGELTWKGDIEAGESVKITLEVTVSKLPEGIYERVIGKNIAKIVVNGEEKDPIEDEKEYWTIRPNIVTSKTSIVYDRKTEEERQNTEYIYEGDVIKYTITGRNEGSAIEKGIQISDTINDKLEYIDVTSTKGNVTYDAITGIVEWTGDLNVGETVDIEITVRVKTTDTLEGYIISRNIAVMKVTGEKDIPIIGEEEYEVGKPNITGTKTSRVYDYKGDEVTKTGPITEIHEGDIIRYNITLRNVGTVEGQTKMLDSLDLSKVEYVSSTANIGTTTYDSGMVIWEGEIGLNDIVVIEIVVKAKDVPDGIYSYLIQKNRIYIEVEDILIDPIEDDYEYIVCKTDVNIIKTSVATDYLGEVVPGPNIHEGDIITYTITVTNNGALLEKGVLVTDNIDTEKVQYIDSSSNGTGKINWNSVTGEFTWEGDLEPGEVVQIEISVKANNIPVGVTEIHIDKNIVYLEANGKPRTPGEDPDDYTVVRSNVTSIKTSAAYKKGDNSLIDGVIVHEGDTLVYTITLKNEGDIKEKVKSVVDEIDASVFENVSVTASSGNVEYIHNATTSRVEWSGDLDGGETVIIEITVSIIETTGDLGYMLPINVAKVTVKDETEPIEDGKQYKVVKSTTIATKSSKVYDYQDNEVLKTGETTVIHERDLIVYSITLENIGDEVGETEITDIIDTTKVDYISTTVNIIAGNPSNPASMIGTYDFDNGVFTWSGDIVEKGIVEILILVEAKDVPDGVLSVLIEKNVINLTIDGVDKGSVIDNSEYIIGKTIIDVEKSSKLYDYLGEEITDTDNAHEGDEITYTISATNSGIVKEYGVKLTDSINISAVEYINSTSYGKGTLNWNATTGILTWIGNLDPNEEVIIRITVKVKELEPGVDELDIGQNTVNIEANGIDRPPVKDPRHYRVIRSNVISEKTSVAYSKENGSEIVGTLVHEGDTIKYTITVTNAGNIREKGIKITDAINTNFFEDITILASKGSVEYNAISNKVEWVGDLNIGETATIEITVKIKQTTSTVGYTLPINMATIIVNGKDGGEIEDPNEYTVGKPVIQGSKSSRVYDYKGQEVIKTGNTTVIHEGDIIKYTIQLRNTGDETGTTKITDIISPNVEYISATASTGTIDTTAGVITWDGSIAPGETVTIEITVKAKKVPATLDSITINENIAELKVNDIERDPIEDPDKYIVARTNLDSVKTSKAYDYLGDEIIGTDTLHENDTIIYTIRVTNDGIAPEYGVKIKDKIGIDKLMYIYNVYYGGGTVTYDSLTGELVWEGDIGPGETIEIKIEVKTLELPAGETMLHIGKNAITITAGGEDQPEVEDPRDYVVVKPNIIKSKTSVAYRETDGSEIAGTVVSEGDTIVYKITLKNEGQLKEKQVEIVDYINETMFENISVTSSKGTAEYDNLTSEVKWTGDIDVGETVTIEITVTVKESTRTASYLLPINKAAIKVNGKDEGEIEDNKEYKVSKINLEIDKTSRVYNYQGQEITKTGTTTTIHERDTIVYTVTVANNGDEETSIEITDLINTSVVGDVQIEASIGTTDWINALGELTWTATVPGRTIATLKITVKARALQGGETSYTINQNEIEVKIEGEEKDPVIDNSNYVVVRPNVDMTKSSKAYDYQGQEITGTNYIHEGDTITYTITATNNGSIEENGVIITDVIDLAKVDYVSNSVTPTGKGNINWNSGTGILTWTGDLGTLTTNKSVTITITVRAKDVPAGQTQIMLGKNIANIKVNGEDEDPVEDPDDYIVVRSNVDITKSSKAYEGTVVGTATEIPSTSFVHEGDTIVYTISVTNNGPARERNITIQDILDEAISGTNLLTHVNASATIGTITPNAAQRRYDWTGNLESGQTAVITITMRINAVTARPNGFNISANVLTARVNGVNETVTDPRSYTVGKSNVTASKTSIAYDPNGVQRPGAGTTRNVYENDTIHYTIRLENSGNEPTTINLKDYLPAGVTLDISSTNLTPAEINQLFIGSGITGSGMTITLPSNTPITITFTTVVTGNPNNSSQNSIRNYGMINDTTQIQDSVTYNIQRPTISVNKSSNIPATTRLLKGDKIIYTISVALTQGNIVKGVTVEDTIPTGTAFSQIVSGTGTYQAGTPGKVVFNLPDITSANSPVAVQFEVEVTQDNKANLAGSTTQREQVTNTATAFANNILTTGQGSNTVNTLLELYANVPVRKTVYEESYEEITLHYPELFSQGVPIGQNNTGSLQVFANNELFATLTITRSSKSYIVLTLTIADTTQTIEIGGVYSGYTTQNGQTAQQVFNGPPAHIHNWYQSGYPGTQTVPPGSYGQDGSGNDMVFIKIEDVNIGTGQYGYNYRTSSSAIPANTFKAKIEGYTLNGDYYVDIIDIPTSGNASFAGVPYGTYTITELNWAGTDEMGPAYGYRVLMRRNNNSTPTTSSTAITNQNGINITINSLTQSNVDIGNIH